MSMESNEPAILCEDLHKSYQTYQKEEGLMGSIKSLLFRKTILKQALAPLDLIIQKGEILGLLGSNGAGKTTLMKMLSGIIMPTSGKVKVFGEIPFQRKNSFKKRIALAMGQKNQLWWDLPAQDSFNLLKEYYEIDEKDYRKRLGTLTEMMQVEKLLNTQVRRLSLGERMKVEIMACLLHSPELIMLDEPTIGLDVVAQERLRQFFRDYHEEHKPTIILTSHYMVDIEALCPRIVMLHEGEKLFDGDRSRLSRVFESKKRLSLKFQPGHGVPKDEPLLNEHQPHWVHENEVQLDITLQNLREVTAKLLTQLPVCDFATEEQPFEAVMEEVMANPELLKEL
jgi:ABC-2 type transport system ATP-binding protein